MTKNEYYSVHNKLVYRYGKANKCQGKNCTKKSKTFDWALLKGKKYIVKIDNFIMLCRSCHVKYDMTNERRHKNRINMIGNKRGFKTGHVPWLKGKHPKYLQGKRHPFFGKTHSPEAIEKIKKSNIGRVPWNKGIPMSKEAKLKLSNSQKIRLSEIRNEAPM